MVSSSWFERMEARAPVAPRYLPFVRLGAIVCTVLLGDILTARALRGGVEVDPLVVTMLRLAASLPVLHFPLSGSVMALEVDKWDWYWLRMGERTTIDQTLYQAWDKSLDLVFLGVATIVALRWHDRRARAIAMALFAWRAMGVVAFAATRNEWALVAFPNVAESFFLLYVGFHVLTGHEQMLASRWAAALTVAALLVPKVGQEYLLHVLNDRPWHVVHVPSGPIPEAWVWGALMYALPLGALVYAMLTARDRATEGDREEDLSVV